MDIADFTQCLDYFHLASQNNEAVLASLTNQKKSWYETFAPVANGIIGLCGVALGIFINKFFEKSGKARETTNKKLAIQEEIERIKSQAKHAYTGARECRDYCSVYGLPPTYDLPIKPAAYCLEGFFTSVLHEYSPTQRDCAFHIISLISDLNNKIENYISLYTDTEDVSCANGAGTAENILIVSAALYGACTNFIDNVKSYEMSITEFEQHTNSK
ncbi:hypothetical protein [Pseudomonas sp. fls2-241-TYG-175]|uniref:hypothetical protein n=1 Tax=Pseudomonas sp. fls2-241-TYG-175 TaxID=3040312 RepID=UPI002553036D|nr:hypothetical protein [Pseudomonas sp. fls2-241-TYG-175]